jgi:hypothetical protein
VGKRRVHVPVVVVVVVVVLVFVSVCVILPCSYAATRGVVVREQGFAIQRARLSTLHHGRFVPRSVSEAIISCRKCAIVFLSFVKL